MNKPPSHTSRLVREYQKRRGLSNVALAKAVEATEGAIRAFYLGYQGQGRPYKGRRPYAGSEPMVFRLQRALKIPKTKMAEALLEDSIAEQRAWMKEMSGKMQDGDGYIAWCVQTLSDQGKRKRSVA